MLIDDFKAIGNKLLAIRKKAGMTQSDVAEIAGLSDRTYADIERGNVNMRIETLIRICNALHITPDDIFTENNDHLKKTQQELLIELDSCSPEKKRTALQLLSVYLDSLKK